jgi:predicted nucleic acid-binding protein
MSAYVIDASVIIEYLVAGQFTAHAKRLFEQNMPTDRLIIPEFSLLECTNVLWRQVRFQGMSVTQAKALLKHLRKIPLHRVPAKAILNTALRVGLTHQLAIYDSVYIALALRSALPLITLDQPQTRAAVAEGITIKPITDFK